MAGDPLYEAYHDAEWGVPEREPRALWEKLVLDGRIHPHRIEEPSPARSQEAGPGSENRPGEEPADLAREPSVGEAKRPHRRAHEEPPPSSSRSLAGHGLAAPFAG